MKKWMVVIAVVLAFCTAGIYLFIPNIIVIDKSVLLNENLHSIYRSLSESKNWQKWWPGKINDEKLELDDNIYTLKDKTVSSAFITINSPSVVIPTSLTFIPQTKDSVKLQWVAKVATSYNPVKRFSRFLFAKKTARQIDFLLDKMKVFTSTTTNLYGLDIKRELVKDSALISTYDSSIGYPSTQKIYSLIDQLREYITTQQATATDSPMLNIYTKDSIYYLTKVAIPTSKRLASSGKIEYRWMLYGGNILVADIKGGSEKIKEGFNKMEDYVQDHKLTAPAIPYHALITNRLAENDSTKWITRIYYPVMYYYD